MKVLVVDPDLRRAPALKDTLMAGGAEVTVASSGSFALTMLEWNRHDVVVSRARIDDMDGHELCAILKSDPGTREVRFVLVAGGDEVTAAETAAAGVDLVLPPSMTSGAILPLVVRLMEANRAPAAEAPPSPAAAVPKPVAPAVPAPPPPPPPVIAPPAAPVVPPAPPVARPAAPEAPAVPRIRPAPAPPPPANPPKSYATVATAGPDGVWAKAAPLSAPAAGGPRPPVPPPVAPRPVAAPASKPVAAPPARTNGAPPARVAPPATPRPAATPTVPDLASMPSGTFQGSLEVMELADLIQAVAAGGKSGRLILALPQGGGLMLFEKGRVVHAEYRNAVGEEAFGALLAACHADGAGRFCFLPSPAGESTGLPRTIDKPVDRLLLSSATAIDEKG
jgi:CheY-like chemotaxis protein